MKEYISVSKLNIYIKSLLESDFSLYNVLVQGEVGSLTKHFSGHYFFTLKDEQSQIKCTMFANNTKNIDFNLENGKQVLIEGYIGVYDKGGTYQLYCRKISLYGEGQYLLKVAQLKERLFKEGIFDKEKKKLPLLPKRIGVISARQGAAIYDFISTVKKRTNTEIFLFPSLVQGEEASKSLIGAIKQSLSFNIDLLVITRGGGSKEDLKAFNDEELVRFVADLNIPVITAVGHTIDTTLIDYVSSEKCITPTDAAVKAVPSYIDLTMKLENLEKTYSSRIFRSFERKMEKIAYLLQQIEAYSPINYLKNNLNKIDNLNKRLHLIFINNLKENIIALQNIDHKISFLSKTYLKRLYDYLNYQYKKLDYLNPYLLLNNGYSLISNKQGQILSSIDKVSINEELQIKMKDGEILVNVKEKKYDI